MRMDNEVREAQQGEENTAPVICLSEKELHIYTDTNDDGRPELICYRSVSYTHLDVYKRQIWRCLAGGGRFLWECLRFKSSC